MVRDVNDQPVPELLAKVAPNQAFTVWTLTLREGITFSDGSPLTSEIVAFNLMAQQNDPANADLLAPIASITSPDATTVVVTMFSAWSTFPELLTTRLGVVAAPVTLLGFDPRPIGTGPFVWTGVDAAGVTVVSKNPNYWKKGLPHLDAVRFVPIPDAADRVTAVIDGKAGMVAVDEPRQLVRLEEITNSETKFTIGMPSVQRSILRLRLAGLPLIASLLVVQSPSPLIAPKSFRRRSREKEPLHGGW
jgi:peptide/nickel transport system substrate-binding protein